MATTGDDSSRSKFIPVVRANLLQWHTVEEVDFFLNIYFAVGEQEWVCKWQSGKSIDTFNRVFETYKELMEHIWNDKIQEEMQEDEEPSLEKLWLDEDKK